jgi:hypothetical protein
MLARLNLNATELDLKGPSKARRDPRPSEARARGTEHCCVLLDSARVPSARSAGPKSRFTDAGGPRVCSRRAGSHPSGPPIPPNAAKCAPCRQRARERFFSGGLLGPEGLCWCRWGRTGCSGATDRRPRSCLRPRHCPQLANSGHRVVSLDAVNLAVGPLLLSQADPRRVSRYRLGTRRASRSLSPGRSTA